MKRYVKYKEIREIITKEFSIIPEQRIAKQLHEMGITSARD